MAASGGQVTSWGNNAFDDNNDDAAPPLTPLK
jgi:hypothetical protein